MGTAWDNNVNSNGQNEVKGIEADVKKGKGRKKGRLQGEKSNYRLVFKNSILTKQGYEVCTWDV